MQRNRSEGWQHAKVSGHKNETKIEELLQSNQEFRAKFLSRLGKPNAQIIRINGGGLKEKNVPSIFANDTTKSKTDVYVELNDGTKYNFSIKKSYGGQVYLIKPNRFIEGYEILYSKIPTDVKRAIELYWGSAEDTENIISNFGTKVKYEKRKHRTVATTIQKYDANLYITLLKWFKENTYNIVDFCFSKGLAKSPDDWANIVWYKNENGENKTDNMFCINDLCTACQENAEKLTEYGNRNGGSTIQLSFGFVQWHSPQKTFPGCLQFHHSYNKISNIVKSF